MNLAIPEQHEMFEIEVLDKLKRSHLLQNLVFGGGTMLRLCYELDRYSADLDFWFVKPIDFDSYRQKMRAVLSAGYELTDNQDKFYKQLFEIRSSRYPRKLKLELRKEIKDWDFQDRIAFSKYSNLQVVLRTHSLAQSIINKVSALLERDEIRDAFDIEFLLRKGAALPELDKETCGILINKINKYSQQQYKVKLGSVLSAEKRKYYIENGFSFLRDKLNEVYLL